jgi:hypothetical protein
MAMSMVKEAKELAKILGTLIKQKQTKLKEDSPDYTIE